MTLYTRREIDSLIEQVGNTSNAWQRAAGRLAKIGVPAVQPLIRARAGGEEIALGRFADVLCKIGSPSVGPLVDALCVGRASERACAAAALRIWETTSMFRPEIATAACAYFLHRSPTHELSDLVLMKLMVIAERESMSETTSLITGAEFVSTLNGPALSQVMEMINGAFEFPLWNTYIMVAAFADANPDRRYYRCALKTQLAVDD